MLAYFAQEGVEVLQRALHDPAEELGLI